MSTTPPPRRPRYLLYTETFPSRNPRAARQTGIGRYCYDLASGLAALGQDVVVLTNTALGSKPSGEPESFTVLAEGEEPGSLVATLRRGSRLTRVLGELRPDLLLVGDSSAHRVCSWLGPRLRVPYCPIFYGSELHVIERTKTLFSLSPIRRLDRWLTARYLRRADETICISRYTAELLRRVAAAPRSACIVYPPVSELLLRQPVDPLFSGDLHRRLAVDGVLPVLLLTIARISERKNQLGVLQAIAQAHQNGPARFHYLIVGNVDSGEHDSYRGQLQSFIEDQGLQQFTSFIANSSDEEKVAYLDACDVLVMLSRTVGASVEGFGISAIEAACRCKPVLVGDEGGMPETIIEGRTGFAVSPEDTHQVASALVTLATDERLRAEMGKAGRAFAQSHFTPEVSAASLHQHLIRRGFFNPGDR